MNAQHGVYAKRRAPALDTGLGVCEVQSALPTRLRAPQGSSHPGTRVFASFCLTLKYGGDHAHLFDVVTVSHQAAVA